MKLILRGESGRKFIGFLFETEVVYIVSEDQDVADLLNITKEEYLKRVKTISDKVYEGSDSGLYLDLKNSETEEF